MSDLHETHDEIETRDLIFKAKDRKEVIVPVEEWGVTILLIALSGTKRSDYFAFHNNTSQQHKGTGEFFKRVFFEQVRLAAFHPKTRKPIFKEADRDTLMDEHNGAIIEELAAMVRELSDLDRSTIDVAKKKLESIQKDIGTIKSLKNSTTP